MLQVYNQIKQIQAKTSVKDKILNSNKLQQLLTHLHAYRNQD